MTEYFKRNLSAKLLLSYFAVVMVGVVVLVLASQFLLPASFSRHMMNMGMNGNMMGMGQGAGNGNTLYRDFRAGFNEALLYAILAAMIAAFVLSLYFSKKILSPVEAMSRATQRITEGRYDERVQVNGGDELAQLANRFNQMAERLDRVETMRRRLIGDVSHELRTPLTAIKGSMEGLIDGVLPADVETFQQIHSEADRLNRLVDDLQELSRMEARAYEMNIQPVDITSVTRTVLKRLASQAEAKRITLDLELDPDLPHVLADEDRLIQVLTNLTGNALQYTPAGGDVLITLSKREKVVQVSVKDSGIGIPPEHLAHIFDRFYRVDKSRSRQSGGGSGIGLTIAKALVEAHGGRLWAESAGEGQGSTFIFTLPVAT